MMELLVRDVLAQLAAFDTGTVVAINVHGLGEAAEQRLYDPRPQITRERGRAVLHIDVSQDQGRALRLVKE